MRQILVVLLLVGCGDPRAPFVGSYVGTGERTYDSGNIAPLGNVTLNITAPAHSDRLQFDNRCMFSAVVDAADSLKFDPDACPTRSGTTFGGATADFADTYNDGTAQLSGASLVIDLTGTEVGSHYSDGHANQTSGFREHLTVRRQ